MFDTQIDLDFVELSQDSRLRTQIVRVTRFFHFPLSYGYKACLAYQGTVLRVVVTVDVF
jgi:hypothetical protein